MDAPMRSELFHDSRVAVPNEPTKARLAVDGFLFVRSSVLEITAENRDNKCFGRSASADTLRRQRDVRRGGNCGRCITTERTITAMRVIRLQF